MTPSEPFRLVPAWLAREILDRTQPEVSMTEQPTPDRDMIETAARAISEHDPIGGGWWCTCAPTDQDGLRESLNGSFERHIAGVVLAAVLPLLRAQWEAEEPGPSLRLTCDDEGLPATVEVQGRTLTYEPWLRAQIADEIRQKIEEWEPTCSDNYIRGMRAALLYVTGEAYRRFAGPGLDQGRRNRPPDETARGAGRG